MNINKIVFILLIPILTNNCYSQNSTIIIFSDDTILQDIFMSRFESTLNQYYYAVPFFDFKEKLPDGTYMFVELKRKDSSKYDLNNFKLIEGTYKNSLRQGTFYYYSFCKSEKNAQEFKKLTMLFNYDKGYLNGYYMAATCGHKLYQGYYNNGMRNGFFFNYNFSGDLINWNCIKEIHFNIFQFILTLL